MSKLTLSTSDRQYQLNVLSFSSPLYGTISSAQTRYQEQHFPIKALQPDLSLDVIFRNEQDYEDFQRFVRNHQLDAQANANLVTVNFPARNIDNYTGMIKQFKAGGMRYNFAPRASFQVDLVDSLLSTRTEVSTISTLFTDIVGVGTSTGVLAPPTAAAESFFNGVLNIGENILTGSGGVG